MEVPSTIIAEVHFYRGLVQEPDGEGQVVVEKRRTKRGAERLARREAIRLNWDWRVEHCLEIGTGDEKQVRVIETWSSIGGHEVFADG